VDTRLRPRGNESDLVHSAAYLAEYCRTEAQAWEALTWLKARPLTGNPALAARAIAAARQILGARFRDPMQLAAELAPMRKRLEEEAAAVRSKNEFKKMAGGNYDIEYALGFLFLTRGVPPVAGHVLRQIAALESAGALDTSSAQGLRTASLLYRSMDHAVRIVTGRSARRLPEPALAARVVPLLERWGIPLAGEASAEPAARISSAVGECQRQVRAIYDSTLSGA
jgi:glutamate-ammonia-ligase adenylyltransferase